MACTQKSESSNILYIQAGIYKVGQYWGRGSDLKDLRVNLICLIGERDDGNQTVLLLLVHSLNSGLLWNKSTMVGGSLFLRKISRQLFFKWLWLPDTSPSHIKYFCLRTLLMCFLLSLFLQHLVCTHSQDWFSSLRANLNVIPSVQASLISFPNPTWNHLLSQRWLLS